MEGFFYIEMNSKIYNSVKTAIIFEVDLTGDECELNLCKDNVQRVDRKCPKSRKIMSKK